METRIEDCYRSGQFESLAFTYAPVGLVVTENRVIRACNLAFADMFGYTVDYLKDRSFSILYPSEDEFVNIRERGVPRLRETNKYWDERVMARKDGSLFWCRVRGYSFTREAPLMRAVWSLADLSDVRPYIALTRRQREVMSLLADGLTSKEIALKLGISYRTVEVYRATLLKKFGVSNSNALFHVLSPVEATVPPVAG